jgi:hypothetical protein
MRSLPAICAAALLAVAALAPSPALAAGVHHPRSPRLHYQHIYRLGSASFQVRATVAPRARGHVTLTVRLGRGVIRHACGRRRGQVWCTIVLPSSGSWTASLRFAGSHGWASRRASVPALDAKASTPGGSGTGSGGGSGGGTTGVGGGGSGGGSGGSSGGSSGAGGGQASCSPPFPPATRTVPAQTVTLRPGGPLSSGTITTTAERLSDNDCEGRATVTVTLNVTLQAAGDLTLRTVGCHVTQYDICSTSQESDKGFDDLTAGVHSLSYTVELSTGQSVSLDWIKATVFDGVNALGWTQSYFRHFMS